MRANTINLAGDTFGSWEVLSYAGRSAGRGTKWLCRCVCGTKRAVAAADLRRMKSTSCGCISRAALIASHFKHGHACVGKKTSEYQAWCDMISRCHDANNRNYKHYGQRGIEVCAAWRNSFEVFLADMGRKPSPDLSLDRIDNDSGYEPKNCRWATRSQQSKNRRPFTRMGAAT